MNHPPAFGPYQVVRPLGQGGMGRVFEVSHAALPGRRLALKQLLGEAGGGELLRRFLREAQLLARVDHPGVVRIHACEPDSPQGPYLVMDLVEGASLEAHRKAGRLEPRQAAELVAGLAGAVAAVHAAGVLHRDLKPENVVLRPDGTPVLLDFGIARGRDADQLTRTGSLLGSPNYMAPEQAEGLSPSQLDERVDVYGLGALLYALVSGRVPHQGAPSIPALLNRVMHVPLRWPEPAELGGVALPAGLVAIGRRAAALRPEERYPSARAVETALRAWLRGEEPASAPPAARPRGALALAGLSALLLALLAGAFAWGRADQPAQAAAPARGPSAAAHPETRVAVASDPLDEPLPPWLELEQRQDAAAGGFFAGGRRLLAWTPEGEGDLVEWACEPPARPRPTSRRWALPARLEHLALAPAGRALLRCGGQLMLLDLGPEDAALRPLRLDPEPAGRVEALALSPRGDRLALALAGAPPRALVYALEGLTGRLLFSQAAEDPAIATLALGEERLLVGGGKGDVAVGGNVVQVVGPAGLVGRVSTLNGISALAFDPLGSPWFGNTGWGIHRLDLEEGLEPALVGVATLSQIDRGPLTRRPAHNGMLNQLRFAPASWTLPDGPRWLFSGSWHPPPLDRADERLFGPAELRLWVPSPEDEGGWRNVAGVGDWPRRLWSLDVTPDGAWALVGHGGALELWARQALPALEPGLARIPSWAETTRALGRRE